MMNMNEGKPGKKKMAELRELFWDKYSEFGRVDRREVSR